jgi:hypothetical protein
MEKPEWSEAPDWAQWLTMDQDGTWYWHEYRPEQIHCYWDAGAYSKTEPAVCDKWRESLEVRVPVSGKKERHFLPRWLRFWR